MSTEERDDLAHDEVPDGPLTELEIRQVRIYIRDEARARWFWASFRIWVKWITIFAAAPPALWGFYELVLKIVRGGK